MFIRMYRDLELMSFYSSGHFRFFPVVKSYETTLPPGSHVDYDDHRVRIRSDLKKISSLQVERMVS